MADVCSHLDQIKDVKPSTDGCEECLKEGTKWVDLRLCLTCGHVGCCDQSIGRHATKHFQATGHPVMESYKEAPEGEQEWRWCFVDKMYLED
jgi:uncharacterized UBP type Zn finger protein